MASVFWDSEVIHVNFLPHGITINAQYYNNLLCNDVHQVTWKKRFGKLSKIILLHDNIQLPNFMVTLAAVSWEIMTHPSYSP
jgi:hypothetical protein